MAISKCLRQLIVMFSVGLCMPSVGWSTIKPGAVTAPEPGTPTTYALFVGINGYEVGPVEDAVRDAHAIFARMTDASLGLVQPEDTILLTEEEADGAAIDAALEDLLRRGDENDTVIFFWAGRSHYDLFADDLFLFPFDAKFHANGENTDGEYSLRRRVLARASAFPGRFVFIGDSCGGFSKDSLPLENVSLLTSARPGEYAIEGFRGHGLFTFHLLNVLDEPRTDADRDGRISLEEAYRSLYQRVVDDSHSRQHPGLLGIEPQTVALARAVPARDIGVRRAELAAREASLDPVKPRADARVAATLAWPVPGLADRPRIDAPLADVRGEPRHALVVGNGSYADGVSRLANPTNDAEDMAEILEKAGFEVTRAVDVDRASLGRAIIEFGRRLRQGGVGLFFYAGHAVQLNGKNYLIPIGAKVADEDLLPLDTIDLDYLLWHMGGADNRLNIVVLDSCRDNPFPRSFRSIGRGLAPMAAPRSTFVAFATAPGDVAFDGFGERNSPFTAALLDMLDDPGLRLEEVFKRVAAKVGEETLGAQTPWVQSSFPGDFYFHPPASVGGPQEVAGEPAALDERPDYLAWKAIEDSREPVDFETFIEVFPDSPLLPFAERRLRSLDAK